MGAQADNCWDQSGQSGDNYNDKAGAQISAIKAMIDRLGGLRLIGSRGEYRGGREFIGKCPHWRQNFRSKILRLTLSTQVLCEIMSQRAKYATAPAPLLYKNLTGINGLETRDPALAALTQPGASLGTSIVTNGLLVVPLPTAMFFPDDMGYYAAQNMIEGELEYVEYQLQDSDVMCVRSAPTDADGYHSLVQTGPQLPLASACDGDAREGGRAGRVGGAWPHGGRLYNVRVAWK